MQEFLIQKIQPFEADLQRFPISVPRLQQSTDLRHFQNLKHFLTIEKGLLVCIPHDQGPLHWVVWTDHIDV